MPSSTEEVFDGRLSGRRQINSENPESKAGIGIWDGQGGVGKGLEDGHTT
jgi:hypothetical protein